MSAALILRNLCWALSMLLELVLLYFLVRRKVYRSHPAFFSYILIALLQSAVVATTYRVFGQTSAASYNIAWGSQVVVICARWLAITEIAKKALGQFSGIWAMVSRILFMLGMGVLVYALVSSRDQWTLAVLTADRAVEMCIASFIVGMFVFVKYYRVEMSQMDRMLAIGFCLYSCFFVINDSIYQAWIRTAGPLWNYLESVTYLATLLLWIGAVLRHSESRIAASAPPLTPEDYLELSGKLNSRLHVLNNRLDKLFHSGDSRS
jgi:hypothetical protein